MTEEETGEAISTMKTIQYDTFTVKIKFCEPEIKPVMSVLSCSLVPGFSTFPPVLRYFNSI